MAAAGGGGSREGKRTGEGTHLGLTILMTNKLHITRHLIPLRDPQSLLQPQNTILEVLANVLDSLLVPGVGRARPDVDTVEGLAGGDDHARDFVGEGGGGEGGGDGVFGGGGDEGSFEGFADGGEHLFMTTQIISGRGEEGERGEARTVYNQKLSIVSEYFPLGSCTLHFPPFELALSSHAGLMPSLNR